MLCVYGSLVRRGDKVWLECLYFVKALINLTILYLHYYRGVVINHAFSHLLCYFESCGCLCDTLTRTHAHRR